MRSEPTDAERALWRILRAKRFDGFKFRRQAPLGRYIADFVCLEKRLIVEADGGQHNESAHDAARDAWLRGQGFHVLRFWNQEVLREAQMVEDTIWRDLHRREVCGVLRMELRDPSPTGGEGDSSCGCRSETIAPGSELQEASLTPKPPSPLAGEGKGKGKGKGSRRTPFISAIHKQRTP